MNNNRILIVDDNKSIHDDFKKILNSFDSGDKDLYELEKNLFDDKKTHELDLDIPSYSIDDAYQGEEALEMIEAAHNDGQPYALVFMDVRMPPGWNGIDTIAKILDKGYNIEIIICTAYSDYSWDEIISKLGTTDKLLYLKKPFNSIEVKQMVLSLVKKWNLNRQLQHLINNLEREVEERTKQLENTNKELEEKNRILSEVALRDSLTGLLNHAALQERICEVFSESRRQSFAMSIIMIDIDHFKRFNDNYGHQVGDEILKKVSSLLSSKLREYDIKSKYLEKDEEDLQERIREYDLVGRYGGDEFVIILPYCGQKEAESIAERLRKKVEEINLDRIPDIKLSASFGVAARNKENSRDDSKGLVSMADKALYKAKSQGRNCICYLSFD